MAEETHTVKKAVVEIYLPTADNAFTLQNKGARFFKEKLLPLVEKIISDLSVKDEVIRIDKLELDFKNFKPEESNEAGLLAFEHTLREELTRLITKERSKEPFSMDSTFVKKVSKEKADEELFMHLLIYGNLPWWAKVNEAVTLENLAQKIIKEQPGSLKESLKKALQYSAVRKRIASRLSQSTIEKIIHLTADEPAALLKIKEQLLHFTAGSAIPSENFARSVYRHSLRYVQVSKITLLSFITAFIRDEADLALAGKLYVLSSEKNKISGVETSGDHSVEFTIDKINSIVSSGVVISDVPNLAVILKKALAFNDPLFHGEIRKIFEVKDRKLFFPPANNSFEIQKKKSAEPGEEDDVLTAEEEKENTDPENSISGNPLNENKERKLSFEEKLDKKRAAESGRGNKSGDKTGKEKEDETESEKKGAIKRRSGTDPENSDSPEENNEQKKDAEKNNAGKNNAEKKNKAALEDEKAASGNKRKDLKNSTEDLHAEMTAEEKIKNAKKKAGIENSGETEEQVNKTGILKVKAEENPDLPEGLLPAEKEQISHEYFADVAEDYFVKNSGIIILTPFLPAFFKELELYDGKEFISTDAKERAVCLLHYLSTGNAENIEEHEMVLNKIICGLEIAAPLTIQFDLSEKEKEESLNLLQAVADNWGALKGTSGEGMRDAFFMRDGIIEQHSNGWNLKIEKTTIDILVDKLPWGISIVKLPWSNEMLFVSW